MLKTRIILLVVTVLLIAGLFMLPKVVVDGDEKTSTRGGNVIANPAAGEAGHQALSAELKAAIASFRHKFDGEASQEKNIIFADSLSALYNRAGMFDSAAWFADQRATFLKTVESYTSAGENYYQAFTFAMDAQKRAALAEKVRFFFTKVLEQQPRNLAVKTKMAMTYVSSGTPMQGIMMLREVLAEDPKNEPALFNMGMLSMQSGQYDKAIERLDDLLRVNPDHIEGKLLLGAAWMNKGDKARARELFEQVKQSASDPSVLATVEQYLKELN